MHTLSQTQTYDFEYCTTLLSMLWWLLLIATPSPTQFFTKYVYVTNQNIFLTAQISWCYVLNVFVYCGSVSRNKDLITVLWWRFLLSPVLNHHSFHINMPLLNTFISAAKSCQMFMTAKDSTMLRSLERQETRGFIFESKDLVSLIFAVCYVVHNLLNAIKAHFAFTSLMDEVNLISKLLKLVL